MIHHISFSVAHPLRVAKALATILQGKVMPFPPNPGGYIVLAGDEFGTLLELYPLNSELIPDAWNGQVGFQTHEQATYYTSFHAAISVPTGLEEIERIAEQEGWRVFPANRDGLFDVIELWVENRLMLELLTPTLTPKYLNALSPEALEQSEQQLLTADARR